jgi:hypothetical protein
MPAIVDASEIARKPHVPDEHRTPSRDDVADYIETEIVAAGEWPKPVKHIADELDCSRSHVTKVLDLYFTSVSDRDRRVKYAPGLDIDIELPDGLETDSEREAYVRGWVQGWHRAHGSE